MRIRRWAADMPGSDASDLHDASFLQCRRMTLSNSPDDAALRERLLGMTSATATHMLNLRGYMNQFMTGALPIQTGGRACGRAVTVRLGPARPDMAFAQEERHQEPLWVAIESLAPGDFLVLDCGGGVGGGTAGGMLG